MWITLTLAALASSYQLTDEEVIRKVLVTFNDLKLRSTVLAPGADIEPLRRFGGQEVSQIYFEARVIRLLAPDLAFVDAKASQYGSTIIKRSMPAYFVLRKIDGDWRVAVMRL